MRLGTRGSALALVQARLVADGLQRAGHEVDVVPIATSGDERSASRARSARGADAKLSAGAPSPAGGDKARFVKEIEDALLRGTVDLAVHSAKDVPSELPEGLAVTGVLERGDPRDALCGARSLDELPEGATVGTSSLRRRSQLLAVRPDLEVRDVRGNVDTRLGRLGRGDFDALVLAAAGLARLGRREGDPIPVEAMTPAPGQGALLLESRVDDGAAAQAAARLTDSTALATLTAERALVGALDATCRTPVGAYAEALDGRVTLWAFAGLEDGSVWVRDRLEGDLREPGALGRQVAERMLAAGGRQVLATLGADA